VFSLGAQCRHELAIKMVFIKVHWFSRHHLQREKLPFSHLSQITQTPKPPFDATDGDTSAGDGGILGDDLTYDDPPLFSDDLSFQPDQSPSGGRIGSPGAAIRRKLSLGDIMGVCSQFTEAIKGHPEVNSFVGVMLQMTELAKDNSSLQDLTLQETLEAHFLSFAKNRRALFTGTREGAPALVPRVNTHVLITCPVTKRYKSSVERRRQSLPSGDCQNNLCSFCHIPAHRINNCPKVKTLGARKLTRDEANSLGLELGEESSHKVETLSSHVVTKLLKIELGEGEVPRIAKHGFREGFLQLLCKAKKQVLI
jgi:hypothetical protein